MEHRISERNSTRFNDEKSALYQAAVKSILALLVEEGEDLAGRACAEALSDTLKRSFQKRHGLTNASPWKRENPPAFMHADFWKGTEEQKGLTTQPYDLSIKTLREIITYCDRHGFRLEISGTSWHFPGRTMLLHFIPTEDSKRGPSLADLKARIADLETEQEELKKKLASISNILNDEQ